MEENPSHKLTLGCLKPLKTDVAIGGATTTHTQPGDDWSSFEIVLWCWVILFFMNWSFKD